MDQRTMRHIGRRVAEFQQTFHALPHSVALIGVRGEILAVNPSWRRFAVANGGNVSVLERMNYLDVTSRAAESGDAYAAQTLSGMLDVFHTPRQNFALDYPCHSPTLHRQFRLSVWKLHRAADLFVVSHVLFVEEPLDRWHAARTIGLSAHRCMQTGTTSTEQLAAHAGHYGGSQTQSDTRRTGTAWS
jgi:hypothetical protein